MIRRFLLAVVSFATFVTAAEKKPNIIFILADDLGYGELGSYGQKVIKTPHLDRMAAEGMRFTHFYSGATVCAPSRSVLMTGQHQGHTRVRGNAGKNNPLAQALRPGDVTVASLLKQQGYTTALFGKWGLGDEGPAEVGLPRKHGFDDFFGYLNQKHAHNHYPSEIWRNEDKVPNEGYSDDHFAVVSRNFVELNKDRPFFLYWSMTVPHAHNAMRGTPPLGGAEVPDLGIYKGKDWPGPDKGHAAMITRLDSYVGEMLEHLTKLGIAENTLVIFTSDNGPHNESGHDLTRFNPSGPFTGIKRSLTDGGIRVPFIAWWPGKVKPAVSNHVGYFGDFMATAAELSGATLPPERDSISLLPVLSGKGEPKKHEFLYWEFHEGGFRQAALYQGRWKGIRRNGKLSLYDQQNDVAEKNDVASQHPDVLAKIDTYLKTARSESPDWPAEIK
jgi:arylsulfatase A-like enzyme